MNHMDEMGIEMPQWVTLPICERTVSNEISGEFLLPDYQPEIRRLLAVTPTVLPPAKYVGGSQIELNGTVDYQVLYVGADGGLYSLPLSSEYNVNVPLESNSDVDAGAGVTVFVTNVAENLTTRVGAPRKLSIRCRLRSHVCAYGRMMLEERCRGSAAAGSLRRRFAEGVTMRTASGLSEPIALQESLSGMSEDTRVVSATAIPFVEETRAQASGVLASGEVLLKLMLGHEDGRLECVTRKLPFSGEIEMEENTESASLLAAGTVSDLSVNVEDGRILCDMEMLLEARSLQNLPIRYTADLYSTEVESRCQSTEYCLPIVCRCENGNLSQSERLTASEWNLPAGAQILDAWGSAQWDGCESVGGKYVLSGQSRYTLLCQRDGEYSTAEVTLPLRYETDGSAGEAVGFDGRAEVLSCRARLDGEVLSLDAELAVIAEFLGEERIMPVTEVEFGEECEARECGMTICFPSSEQSAWDIAKLYRISPECLTEKQGRVPYYLF